MALLQRLQTIPELGLFPLEGEEQPLQAFSTHDT